MKKSDPVEEYLNYLNKICGFAKRTIKSHERTCRRWKDYLLKERQKYLGDVIPQDLLDWIIMRRAKGVKNVTIRGEMCIFRTLYAFLFDYGFIETNPAACLPDIICRPADEQEYLTIDECFLFLNAFDRGSEDGNRNYIITALLWSTGLRSSELCALRWKDIDLKEKTLLVRKGKGGRQRLLFLNDRILKELRQYNKKTGKDEDGPVFAALTNNQHTKKSGARSISQSALVDIIRNHAKANGFEKKISPKTFRHTFATHMLEVGTPLEDIKEMLGHDDETETCIYIHVSVDAARSLLENHIANFK